MLRPALTEDNLPAAVPTALDPAFAVVSQLSWDNTADFSRPAEQAAEVTPERLQPVREHVRVETGTLSIAAINTLTNEALDFATAPRYRTADVWAAPPATSRLTS